MHCIQCGAAAEGRFCASCGATLTALSCAGCGTSVPAGTRFCTACGTPVGARAPGTRAPGAGGDAGAGSAGTGDRRQMGGAAGWWVSGGLLVILIAIGAYLVVGSPGRETATNAVAQAPLGPASGVDLASMTPREAADNLFFRVMRAAERGDYEEADSFLPMAIAAYEIAGSLDEDGLFHLSLLQRAAGEHEAAFETAREGLADNPDHLLNLAAAAEAARELGDLDAARDHYVRMLEAWDRELAAMRPEYDEHHPLMPIIREDAEVFLAEAGP